MSMFAGMSYWPWIIAAGWSFLATFLLIPRIGSFSHWFSHWPELSALIFAYLCPIGGGAFVAALAGMIEGADNGLLVGRGVLGIISFMANLIVSGAFISFWAFLLGIKVAAFFYDKRGGSSP
jgi:hypothetical protein